MNLEKSSGYASIEVGGGSGAFIDMKNPFSDDFDCRLITDGTGLDIIASGSGNHPIAIQSNSGEYLANFAVNGGENLYCYQEDARSMACLIRSAACSASSQPSSSTHFPNSRSL